MSVNPTEYDVIQDGEIQDLKDIVTTTYAPPNSTEVSFPVVDRPLNDEEWGALAKSWGSGIVSFGQWPYQMIFDSDSDVTNQVRITPATDMATKDSVGVIEGFAHRLLEDKLLSIPAVSTRTRYLIALQYDPVRAQEGGRPIVLDAFAGTLDQSQGKKYVLIHEGYRDPSTVLSQMTWRGVRSRLAPTITVQRQENLPNPQHSGLIWGTRCLCTEEGTEWMLTHHPTAEYMRWEPTPDPKFSNPGDTSAFKWPGHGYRRGHRQVGKTIELRGRAQKIDGTDMLVGGNSGNGYQLFQLLEDQIPEREQRFITPTQSNRSPCMITAGTDGRVVAYAMEGPVPWAGLDGIKISLEE